MSLSGLSVREAEASVQKYGLNERTADISFADYFIGGLTSLSCKLFVIAAMVKIVMLLLGLLEITAPVSDITSIFVLVGLALVCALFEATVRYNSDRKTMEICTRAKQSVYTVLRGGKPEPIGEKMLAVGDIVYLSAGDVVPADGIIADGQFIVDQSEYGILEKAEKTTPPSTFYGNRAMGLKSAYSLYKGSVISEGSGAMKITATGDNVFAADKMRQATKIHGNNFSSLIRTGGIIAAVFAVAVLVFCTVYGAMAGQFVRGTLEGVSAAAVVLAIICICGKNLIIEATAASIINKLDNEGVKVSKPDVLNDMAGVRVVFSDKVGSYTDGDYVVSGFIDGTGNQIEKLEDINEKVVALIKTAAINTSAAYIDTDNTVYGGTSADRAILNFVKKATGKAKVKRQASLQKNGISGVTVNLDGKLATFFSGNAELVISKCSDSFSADGKKRRITNKEALLKLAATISLTGNDVIALAVCDRVIKDEKHPTGNYTLVGMVVLHDKLYENISEVSDIFKGNDIKSVLLTAASRETVISTLKKTGNKSKGVILSSEQLAKMNDKELDKHFSDIRAVVNADYKDKIRIIRAAAERQMKICVICADAANIHSIDMADVAIASSECPSAIRNVSDASAEVSGLTAAALLHKGSISFEKLCRIFISARVCCAVLIAIVTVISIIGG